jgi:hypothetical protein
VIGALIITLGLYCVIWGTNKDHIMRQLEEAMQPKIQQWQFNNYERKWSRGEELKLLVIHED